MTKILDFIIITADGCKHCTALKSGENPIINQIKNKLSTINELKFYHINFKSMSDKPGRRDNDAYDQLININKKLITMNFGFPAFYLIINNNILQYNSYRTPESIYNWVISHKPNIMTKINDIITTYKIVVVNIKNKETIYNNVVNITDNININIKANEKYRLVIANSKTNIIIYNNIVVSSDVINTINMIIKNNI